MFARTQRLLLRPSWPEDARALYDAVADEAIVRNLARAPWPYAIEDARQFTQQGHDTRYPNFVLLQRTDGAPRLIGSCGIANRNDAAELGFWIARPYWGLGFASEAARAVIDAARALGHARLTSCHFTDDPASGHVLRKLGFDSTGRTEIRYCGARGHDVPIAIYELDLTRGSAWARHNRMRDRIMPYDAQPIAA
jgi:RimJ/RimL family protein N-acetyltransferase